MNKLVVSTLPKTWIIDVDGVIFEHNKYLSMKEDEIEEPLPGVVDFFKKIKRDDFVILLTAREEKYRERTVRSLNAANIRFDALIMGLPKGERVLINDKKPKGLLTARAVNLERNAGLKDIVIIEDETI
nr:hypothetical protein [Fervidobacterium pennivorans]